MLRKKMPVKMTVPVASRIETTTLREGGREAPLSN
jgi:hypothetical protein